MICNRGCLLFALLTILALAHASDCPAAVKPADICKKGQMKIGVAVDDPDRIPGKAEVFGDTGKIKPETGYPPFLIPLFKDDGTIRAVGYDIEIINFLAENFCIGEGTKPEVKLYYDSFDRLFERLRTKQLDLLVAAISPNVHCQTRRGVIYSIPYHEPSGQALLGPPEKFDDTYKAEKLERLKDSCPELRSAASNTLLPVLADEAVYFLGDTLGKEKLSYLTGIPAATLEKCRVTPVRIDKLQEMLDAAVKARGLILLDLATARFYKDNWSDGNDRYWKELKGWQFFSLKTGSSGTADDGQYLLAKSGEVIAARDEDVELMSRIDQLLSKARFDPDVKKKIDEAKKKWFGEIADGRSGRGGEGLVSYYTTKSLLNDGHATQLNSAAGLTGYKNSISFGFEVGAPLTDKASQKVSGSLEYGRQNAGSILEWGAKLSVSEEPFFEEDVKIELSRKIRFGPFWRFHGPWKFSLFSEPWIGFQIAGVFKNSLKDDNVTNTFTRDREWRVSLVPEAGWDVPFTDKIKIQITISLVDALFLKGHPESNVQLGAALKMIAP